jgi:hypothetical protein
VVGNARPNKTTAALAPRSERRHLQLDSAACNPTQLLHTREVAGSIPAAPTEKPRWKQWVSLIPVLAIPGRRSPLETDLETTAAYKPRVLATPGDRRDYRPRYESLQDASSRIPAQAFRPDQSIAADSRQEALRFGANRTRYVATA